LRGRCIKITEASGSSGTAGDHSQHRSSISTSNHQSVQRARAEQASGALIASHADDLTESRNKAQSMFSSSRMVTNSMANDPSKAALRIHRESISQVRVVYPFLPRHFLDNLSTRWLIESSLGLVSPAGHWWSFRPPPIIQSPSAH
jgi:hypothetical protein